MTKFNAGKYIQKEGYKSFLPNQINQGFSWSDAKVDILLEEASKCLGELNAYSSLIPDIDFFVRMHFVKEANNSSRIEGTKTNINDMVLPEAEIEPEKRNDWEEVNNYINAMDFAVKELDSLPLSLRLLKEIHRILLSGVRGEHKIPGEIRISQNWIGGSSLQDAIFIPPHKDDLPDLLSDWEKFWHNTGLDIPILIKIAMAHYQFETIHPFLDGNGRIGRLNIILQLIDKKVLRYPVLYLSEFFEKNKSSYYASLTHVRTNNDIEQWIKFFLSGIIEVAKDSKGIFEAIIRLRQEYNEKIATLGRKAKMAQRLMLYLFSHPTIDAKTAVQQLGTTYNTANELLKDLETLDILQETTGFSRNRFFVLYRYLILFK
jgi:Fic family protein